MGVPHRVAVALSPPVSVFSYRSSTENHLHLVPLAQASGWAAEEVERVLSPGLPLGARPVGAQWVGGSPYSMIQVT